MRLQSGNGNLLISTFFDILVLVIIMSETKGIYRLLYRYYNGKTKDIVVGDKKLENLPLTNIDLLTSQTSNDEELTDLLNLDATDYQNGRFVVAYTYKKEERYLDIVYKDMESIIDLAKKNKDENDVSKKSAQNYIKEVINNFSHTPELLSFLSKDEYNHSKRRYMNKEVSGAIQKYLNLLNSPEPDAVEELFNAKIDLQIQLRKYKNIRGISLGIYHYILTKQGRKIPMNPSHISEYERAKRAYELNNSKRDKVEKPALQEDNQLRLFDPNDFGNNGRTRK